MTADPGPVVHGDERTRKPQLITCGCGAAWTALGAAHCGACHETFAAVGLFDAHRSQDGPHGTCMDPEALAGLFFRDGMWRGPEMSAEAREAIRGDAPVLGSGAAVGGLNGGPEGQDTGVGSSEAHSDAAAVSP